MTVIYFMLSAIDTPKLANVLGTESVGCHVIFHKQILLFYGYRYLCAIKKRALLNSLAYEM